MFKHINQISEQAFLIDFGSEISIEKNIKVNLFSEFILNDFEKIKKLEILNCVPSYNKILIQFEPLSQNKSKILDYLYSIKLVNSKNKIKEKIIEIPICYDKSFALDIKSISKFINLSEDDIINEHLNTLFHVYMIGFLPGLPFMGNINKKYSIPRKITPRLTVPKGSVAIVDKLCVIYPQTSPGGWNIIGRTPINLFRKNMNKPIVIKPGNKVRFKKISLKEFNNYA